ncbi:autotransporter domain-containing protein [Tahibacter amnicola]|uniref:Autotransporter domain-containing protein n=1 Tax=Tahibacter amnicola TaxID=2976241 RepID=A0ABY6BHE0_9GAMM|nr:autotransporter domain-containing protein [Tahibacter amnicola]UXI68495.1 autotransporter domain-containing protein [Tahibacter amnicola]
MNTFTHPCRTRMLSAARRCLASLLLAASFLCTMPSARAQQAATYSGVQVARTGSTFSFGARNFPTSHTAVRFAMVSSPDQTDSFPNGTTLTPGPGGNISLPITFGPTPGVRIIRFCSDDQIDSCSPAFGEYVVHIGVVSVQCNLATNPSPFTGTVPLQGTASASCDVQTGANVQVTSATYNWALPPGTIPPRDPPPTPVTAAINITAAGTYNVQIAPSFRFSITRTVLFNDTTEATNNPVAAPAVTFPITAQAVNVPPTVTLDSPTANFVIAAPSAVPMTATANDPDGTVQSVEFLVDGNVVGRATTAPFQATWPRSTSGHHTFAARATDNVGAVTQTAPVTVTIRQAAFNEPPTVRLTSPAAAQEFAEPANIALTVEARDSDGAIERVEYFANSRAVGSSTTAPFGVNLQALPAGDYSFVARAIDNLGTVTDSLPVNVVVRTVATQLSVNTSADDLRFEPGTRATIGVSARDVRGGLVRGARLRWSVDGGTPKVAACTEPDSPLGGEVTTDANGTAQIAFVPGCVSTNRQVSVFAVDNPSNLLNIELRGPDARAGGLVLTATTPVIAVKPQEATPVGVRVSDDNGAPVRGATIAYSLTPADAGTITDSVATDATGQADASLLLNPTAINATVKACIASRPTICVNLPVSSTIGAIADPAENMMGPIVRQALDAPRTQLTTIGNRLRTLRNETGHGFSSDVSLTMGGLSVPVNAESSEEDEDDADDSDGGAGTGVRPSFFVAGAVDLGSMDSRTGKRNGFDATTRGITVGADYRFKPGFVAGAALGGMRSSTDLDGGGSQSAKGYSGSLYALWLPTEKLYVNTALNVGRSDFDSERIGCGIDLRSDTQSRHRALLVEAGYAMANKATRFTPFVRYEYSRASIDGLRERGDCLNAIAIDPTDVSRSTVSAGATADMAISTRSGVWIPSIAVEFFGENEQQDEIIARLIADSDTAVPVTLEEIDKRYAMLRFAVHWMTSVKAQPISSFAGFDMSVGRSGYKNRSFMIGVKIPF